MHENLQPQTSHTHIHAHTRHGVTTARSRTNAHIYTQRARGKKKHNNLTKHPKENSTKHIVSKCHFTKQNECPGEIMQSILNHYICSSVLKRSHNQRNMQRRVMLRQKAILPFSWVACQKIELSTPLHSRKAFHIWVLLGTDPYCTLIKVWRALYK